MSDGFSEAMRGTYFIDEKYTFIENRTTSKNITKLNKNEIFVFGSNTKGRHGKGAAKTSLKWGSIYGQGDGPQGNTYAIPTKDDNLNVLSIDKIRPYVESFIIYAIKHPEQTFLVTPIGTGLSGYSPIDIAPLFESSKYIKNIHLPKEFWDIIISKK
jgi:hypothetical protein